jgi:hypothetical protein
MKITELETVPNWLRDAETSEANVEIINGYIVWRGGVWHGGVWHGGEWLDSRYSRILYMAALCGIIFDSKTSMATAYRTTAADGHGRYTTAFVQPEGEYFESCLPAAGSGTCVKGIHVSSAAVAWSSFGIDPTCQFWSVQFKQQDLLDCDGQKCRIAGGFFSKIAKPF